MQRDLLKRMAALLFILALTVDSIALGASLSDPILQAKQEAEAKGYVFVPTHDEIMAGAKKERQLRLLGALAPSVYKSMINAFKKRYPFVTDVSVEEIGSIDAKQRFLLELKSKRAAEWDVFDMAPDLWGEYMPYIKMFDILGMATQKVLAVPTAMIDPKNRNIVSTGSSVFVVGYNKKLIAKDKIPNSWEQFLKPEFKGKKFMVDIRPFRIRGLGFRPG